MIDEKETIFYDFAFRQKRKKGRYKVVESPCLGVPIADTHAHLFMLSNPRLALARAAQHHVEFISCVVDICEIEAFDFDGVEALRREAAYLLAQMRCAFTDSLEQPENSTAGSVAFEACPAVGTIQEADYAADLQEHVFVQTPTNQQIEEALASIPRIRITIGCHPHNAKDYTDAKEVLLAEYLAHPLVCALGEIGLDYHYDLSPRSVQVEVFKRQVRLAREAHLPIALHLRDAHDEALECLREVGFPEAGTLLHCFNRDIEVLAPWVEAGCYIAYGGALTFKKSDEVRASVSIVPRDKLLLETDCPYMAPEPMRGIECGPDHTLYTAAMLAEVCGAGSQTEQEQLLQQVYKNSLALLEEGVLPWQTA